eukprot:TRINITY_DN67743_c0_g1_i1.p1 TRINITY_DN67743_c0_g1~~TRINITY_DN67743_c0_g1_i1.p1  ORF type:complete len:430 (+),score=88.92 TRINITY_DN67743_c0_g1_i1:58-1347(+)
MSAMPTFEGRGPVGSVGNGHRSARMPHAHTSAAAAGAMSLAGGPAARQHLAKIAHAATPALATRNAMDLETEFLRNAFDEPFKVLRGLQAEVADLRADAQRMQQQRDGDMDHLPRELSMLREALEVEVRSRVTSCAELSQRLSSEVTRIDQDLVAFKAETSETFVQQKAATCAGLKDVTNDLSSLATTVEDHRAAGQVAASDLREGLHANAKKGNQGAQEVLAMFAEHRQMLDELQAQQENNVVEMDQLLRRSTILGQNLSQESVDRQKDISELQATHADDMHCLNRTMSALEAWSTTAVKDHRKLTSDDFVGLQQRFDCLEKEIGSAVNLERKMREDADQKLDARISVTVARTKRGIVRIEGIVRAKINGLVPDPLSEAWSSAMPVDTASLEEVAAARWREEEAYGQPCVKGVAAATSAADMPPQSKA